jgi:hypothetical protein
MSDPAIGDTALIDRLTDLGEQLERGLDSDGLADSVMARIVAERSADQVSARPARRWLLAAAVLLLIVVLVALPGSRRTIARWFGVGSVRIDTVETVPAPTATGADTGAVIGPLDLGPAVGADEAIAATGLPLPVATSLGDPESFYLPGGPQIVARYDVGGRTVLVAVLAGSTDEPAFVKQVGPGQVTPVEVRGADGSVSPGSWIDGDPHAFAYIGADGQAGIEPIRIAGDTLLWARDGATFRVEGARDLAEALEIAATMEP